VTDERAHEQALSAAAALLEQGRVLHVASLFFFLAVIYVASRTAAPYGPLAAFVGSAVAVLETYLAVRVGLDTRLFRRLADQARDGRLDFEAFDEGMLRAGLTSRQGQERDVFERIRGGRALFARQAAATMSNAALAGVLLFLAEWGA
jgi:hypothetical protein